MAVGITPYRLGAPLRRVEVDGVENPRGNRRWFTRVIRGRDDDGAMDRAMNEHMSPEERVAVLWNLTLHSGAWTGADYGKQRLQRTVVRVQRRGR